MAIGAGPGAPPRAPPKSSGSLAGYVLGVGITVAAILSQYVVPQAVPALRPLYANLLGDLAVVYGIPIVAFALLVGGAPLKGWASRMGTATWEGLRWYGLYSALALVVIFGLTIVYLIVDPGALDLLSRPNPALEAARSDPWFWVAFSFAIGACEETIFRGWIFGYWLGRPGGSWVGAAIGSSAIFAGVHLYYGFTYAAAAPLVFPELFFLGFAFATAVRASGGNLVVVAFLHGLNDAGAFLTLVNSNDALLLHYGVIGIGLVVALVSYLGRPSARPPPPPFYPGLPAGTAPFDPYAFSRFPAPPPGPPPTPPPSGPSPDPPPAPVPGPPR
jgi:membrane protease YdiL (CAAX protease family)